MAIIVDNDTRLVVAAAPGGENAGIGRDGFFEELVGMGGVTEADPDAFAELRERYGLEMDLGSVPDLCARFGLTHPML